MCRMASVEEHLRRWSEAGVIDAVEAERIRAFEAIPSNETAPAPEARLGVVEAILYLGLAIAAAGAVFLGAENWADLQPWARIAALAVPAVLALVAGAALRTFDDPGYRRAGNIAWLSALALAAGATGVIGGETNLPNDRTLLLAGVVATLIAAGLWAISSSHPQILGLGGALFLLAEGVGNAPDDYSAQVAGMVLLLLGAMGIALAESGMLSPRSSARAIFGFFAIAGPYHAGIDGSVIWAELLVFVVGAALIALAVRRNTFEYMVIAVAGMFVGLITFVFEHLSDSIGVALSLLLSGAAIVAGVLLLATLRKSTRKARA